MLSSRVSATRRSIVRRAAVLAALATVALPSLAAAQPKGGAKPAAKEAKAGRTLSFEDDVIETTLLRPDTVAVEGMNKNKRASLIRIRMTFFAEIIRSAEDL